MIEFTTPILPYKGTGIFKLNAPYNEIKTLVTSSKVRYSETVFQPNKIHPEWYLIDIYNNSKDFAINLAFAKNRLFRITLGEDFKGALPNGIRTGMTIEEALSIDKKLWYNDDNDELYESPEGYWLDYYCANRKIFEITIFIPALERDDFFDYNW